ncbi:hypothetical protein QR680_005931 [Steinernema hermaphroditum]|uniref:Calponin-homology (CH) domain-containing protein n=1 Tax=Steinernema hermaphroditum TaxID=289476 RepID=A0AA39HW62_9BILA|nr:hypothetical protein QR680_005931 [Steinernema hermaphroditum]
MDPEQQEARKKELERRMNARSEALKAKRLLTPRKAKFDASETAQIFVDFTGSPESPSSPVTSYDTEDEHKKQFAASRRKELERRMNARSEALKTKRLSTPQKSRFDASETAQMFLDFSGAGESPSSPKSTVYDTEEEHKKQFAALSEWINHLVGTDFYDTSEVDALMAKTKTEATKFLRDMLISAGKPRGQPETRTKEEFNAEAIAKTRKLNFVRERASTMFTNSHLPSEINRLIQTDSISVRPDKKVFFDIGLQTEILQLFLSFHPIWLEIGLEIVTGRRLSAAPKNQFIAKTTRLIRTYIISDPSILDSKKYALGRTKSIITPEGQTMLHKHFMAKVCHFMVAVELMRSGNLVPQVKCLFLKNSSYKCFNDVFVMLSREVLAGSTNLPKLLKKIGFAPEFKQGFFEEYDYSVSGNFTKTLADGLTLGKVVEIVAGYEVDHVIKMLRNPGGDRLRKLGNLKVVLQMAESRGIDVRDVKPELIVACDVDTILEVLWRIISFYSVSKHPLHAAARGFLTRRRYAKEIASFRTQKPVSSPPEKPSDDRDKAATVIQAAARGFLVRRKYANEVVVHEKQTDAACIPECSPEEREKAAITIQTAVREFLAKKKHAKEVPSHEQQAIVKCIPDHSSEDREKAAIVIQTAVREFLTKRKHTKEVPSCHEKQVECQAIVKHIPEYSPEDRERAAIIIQTAVRGFLTRRRYLRERAIIGMERPIALGADSQLPIYDRTVLGLRELLDNTFKIRYIAACKLAQFAWFSSRCAEYIVLNNGIPIIVDSMNNVNRGFGTEDMLYHLGSILGVLVKSRSPTVRSEVRKQAAVIVDTVFHHMYAHHKSERLLPNLADTILGLFELHVSAEPFKKVTFQVRKIWEWCCKLPRDDCRYQVMCQVVRALESYK